MTGEPARRRVEVLPEHLANKIAAGEVIQRPESVVKELLENALDAGATEITVVLREGGHALIEVSDNGAGMDERDAVTSFLRHATSKIVTDDDLEAITTYGFRGEALASVAAVARVTMKTRRAEDEAAVVVRIDGGGDPHVSREGRAPGTTVTVQHIFYNVPARRKFLKSANTEFRHVYETVVRAALSHPEIRLDFFSDDDVIFRLPAAPLEQRIVDLFGDRTLEGLLPVDEQTEPLQISGYVGKPAFGQRSRTNQFLFLNGRPIANRSVTHAVYSAYEHLLIHGTFPFFIIYLTIDPTRIDVNVHPSKMEVKFEDEQGIHRMLSAAVRRVLASSAAFPAADLTASDASGDGIGLRFTPRQHGWPEQGPGERVDPGTGEILQLFRSGGLDVPPRMETGAPLQSPVPAPGADRERSEGEPGGLLWQLHNKYILSQIKNGVMIVDQHVAHERVLYERALERFQGELRTSQQLLFPSTQTLSAADYALVGELQGELATLGFDITLFGGNTIVVQGVPPDVRVGTEENIVAEMLALYKEYRQGGATDVRDNLAKSYSCRSAIKAGDRMSEMEMRSLIDQLFATKMPYVCPHGRPIVLRISIDELDRRFGRT